MISWFDYYFEQQKKLFDQLPIKAIVQVAEMLNRKRSDRQKIFIAGNGGSASNASHFAQDVTKGASDALSTHDKSLLRCVSLTDNVSWITALANDYTYDHIFSNQLARLATPGDVFIAVSVSGTSSNLVRAAQLAKGAGLTVVSLVGERANPLRKVHLKDLSDHVIQINDPHFGRVEDLQMSCLHALAYYFQENAGDI
jgi:D-sedoheptulose 7-phosphate isomerase